ncbi:MAG: tetratricopeptide repeat protein [Candidatus Riflebacteria bacterium]|nr:tetratricopeptide repeat protein [Candidatus Riflebacteria bacterium]
MICPDCGTPQPDGAGFCTVCGINLTTRQLDRRALILFYTTPLFLLLAGIAFSYDLGSGDPIESGTGLGIFISLVYIVSAGVYWMTSKAFHRSTSAIGPWVAGMFGVFEFLAALALSYPLFECAAVEHLRNLPMNTEEEFQLGLVFAVFLSALFTGLIALSMKETAFTEKRIPTIFARFGTIGTLGATLALFIGITFLFPTFHRNYLMARLYADLGRGEHARSLLAQSLKERPDFAPALYMQGVMNLSNFLHHQSMDETIDMLQRAVKADPGNTRYLLALSMAQEQAGHLTEAVKTASEAISINPHEALLWSRKGDLLLTSDHPDEAIESYRTSLKIKPDDPRTLNNLAFTMVELNRDLPAALDLAKESVAKQPGFVYNTDTLAWALYKNGRTAEAFESIKELKNPTFPSTEIEFHYLAIANELGLVENATEAFSKLLANPRVHDNPTLEKEIMITLASVTTVISAEAPVNIPSSTTSISNDVSSITDSLATGTSP